ncbi:sugar 3,4-ketoisomerase [Acetoanaerobium sticklandii]|uniref:sugar 3,4-ketoisomerase n=1 Tax=Acetoanaerobium sticklandii TaxID=1511 RepID=UPI003A8EE905
MNIGQIININKIGNNEYGFLSFFESNNDIPFEIKRVYYIYKTPVKSVRGFHAHKDLQQVLWCPHGNIEILLDNGINKETYNLDEPNKLLLVGSGIWREMKWQSNESILCVVASNYYDESDYIRDYEIFLKLIKEGYWNGN